jgi:ribosomal protein L29
MAEHKTTRQRVNAMHNAGNEELDAIVAEARKAIYQFRKDRLSKPQENVKVVRNSRKEIARALTIKREHELAAQRGKS